MIRKILQNKISRIKNESYTLDDKLTNKDLLVLSFERIHMLFRSIVIRFKFKKCGKNLFLGKNVKIKHKKRVKISNNCTIEDNVYINALSKNGITMADNVKIGRNSIIEGTGVLTDLGDELIIKKNVGISANAFISFRGKIEIGENTIIGPGLNMHSENHKFTNNKLIRNQGVNKLGIIIEENCWIGSNVTILDGVIISSGTVVAAGSVVTKNTEKNTIVGGVPARFIKNRIVED